MRFMLIRRADAITESGAMPDAKVLADMVNYNEEMVKAGILRDGVGLKPSAQGARVKVGEVPTVTDGPFTETKELIAGFSMIDVGSLAEAIEWTKRWPASDAGAEIEIRQVFELDDFGDALAPELREQEERQMKAAKTAAPKA